MFDNFNNCMSQSISCSSDISIIGSYTNCNGYILELTENKSNAIGLFVKYFNSSFFSSFSYEQEYIFVGGYSSVTFNSIYYMNNNHNYKIFLNSINIFKNSINGHNNNKKINKVNKINYLIIDKLIQNELNLNGKNNEELPIYPCEIKK